MSAHFSDPYFATVLDAITSAPRGINFGDLANECPPEESGDLNAALKELRKRGLIETVRGLYYPAQADALPPMQRPAAPPAAALPGIEFVNATPPAAKGAAQPVFHAQQARLTHPTLKEHMMAKQTQRKGMPASIEPHVLELLAAGPCLLGALIERDGGAHQARQLKQAINRMRAKGSIKVLGGRPKLKVYGLPGQKLSAAECDAILETAPKRAVKGPKKPAAKIIRTKGLKTFAEQRANLGTAVVAAARKKAQEMAQGNGVPGDKRRLPDGLVPAHLAESAGFRVGLFSDGTLEIFNGEDTIVLRQEQTRPLFAYLDQFQSMFGAA